MIFVTGGTGLVGSHILLKLCQKNMPFKALKRKGSSLAICEDVFRFYDSINYFQNIEWVNGDVNDIPSLEKAMKNCDKVIHAAAIVSFHKEDSELMYKTNIEGTKNIMNVALYSKIKKVSYISSIASLGRNTTNHIIDEDCYFKLNDKESSYALSKYYSEQEVWRASQEGLDVVISNPSLILGPGDWSKGSSQIFQKINSGLKFYTEGSTGYVDVIDVANCAILLLESEIKNERFIINGENLKYKDLFNLIADEFSQRRPYIKVTPLIKEIAWRLEYIVSLITGKRPLITKESVSSAMTESSYSNKKIHKFTDYKFTPINECVSKYCKWFLNRAS